MERNIEQPAQSDPLLRTKLCAPAPRGDVIHRPRLIAALQDGLQREGTFTRKLTLISAPAGYGKTTLAGQWLSEVNLPAAWLTLESSENDSTRFLRYLVAALQNVSTPIGTSIQGMLQAPQRPPLDLMLTALINELSSFGGSLLLVLDDYHVIQSQPVHEILNFLVEHLPSNVHLVITSREDPPLPLHRLRARRQMLGIRQAELSFVPDEAGDFFQRIAGLDLTQEQASRLTRRTEGWITGLQLAALSMKSAPDMEVFIDSFTGSNRFILDYLFEEVFEVQSEELKYFLLQTAILERLCADLVNAVTGGHAGQELLEQLEHANFFIVPLDQSRQWYRYHRLFVDLLRHRLKLTAMDLKGLHERAGRWYAEHGYFEQAVEHALAGQLWALACEWIAEAGDRCLRQGEVFTVLGWCRQVPEPVWLQRADWALSYAWALILAGELHTAESLLGRIKKSAGQVDSATRGEIAAAEAYISRSRGDQPRTIELSRQALALLPEDDRANRGTIALNLGLITWHLGQLDEAERALLEAAQDTRAVRNHYGNQTALLFMGRTLGSRGQLTPALDYLHQALSIGEQVPTAVLVHTDLAAIAFERNRLQDAWSHLDQAEAIASSTHSTEFSTACAVQRALLHLGLGQVQAAADALHPALELAHEQQFAATTHARITACQAQIAIAAGDLDQARTLMEAIPFPHDAQTFYRFIDLDTARLHRAMGEIDQARSVLDFAHDQAEAGGWCYALQAISVLEALVAEDLENAVARIEPALMRAEAEGYLRIFLNEGDALLAILKEAARRGLFPQVVGNILAAAETYTAAPPGAGLLIDPLTEREIEVLRLLAAGLSNRQIAAQLVVSLGTAKAHIHHIFGKLGVSSRTQAASRAQELGLI